MKFKIHYTHNGVEDAAIFEHEDIERIRIEVNDFFRGRGIDPEKANAWSEELR